MGVPARVLLGLMAGLRGFGTATRTPGRYAPPMSAPRRPALIAISGPIASGKSALAKALSAELRSRGSSVALTDLDTVAEMTLPTLPEWE